MCERYFSHSGQNQGENQHEIGTAQMWLERHLELATCSNEAKINAILSVPVTALTAAKSGTEYVSIGAGASRHHKLPLATLTPQTVVRSCVVSCKLSICRAAGQAHASPAAGSGEFYTGRLEQSSRDVCLSVCHSVCLSVSQSVSLSDICHSVCLSVCLSDICHSAINPTALYYSAGLTLQCRSTLQLTNAHSPILATYSTLAVR